MNVFDKSPVRVLEKALGGGLGRGNFGVAIALGIVLLSIAFIVNLMLTLLHARRPRTAAAT